MRYHGPRAISSFLGIVLAEVPAHSRKTISTLLTLLLAALVCAGLSPRAEASGELTPKPNLLQFGSVSVGHTNTLSVTIYNTGTAATTLLGETLAGAGYSVIGLTLPKTLGVGAKATFLVKFAPTKTATLNGRLEILSTAGNSAFVVPLYGAGATSTANAANATAAAAATGHITTSVGSAQFKNVPVGTKSTQTIQLKNDGKVSITLTGVTPYDTGFSVSGISTPLTLAPGASAQFSAIFQPKTAGSYAGSVAITSTAADSRVLVTLTGNAVASGGTGHISTSMTAAQFGNVPVGTKNTQSIQVKNDGTVSVTITGVTPYDAGFSVSGISTPLTLAPGATTQFAAAFLPTAASSYAGSVAITSTAADNRILVTLAGKGVSSSKVLTVSPSSVAFGSVSVNSSVTRQITVTNGGNSSITISGDSVKGTGLSATALNSTTLAAGQSAVITADFAPKAAGAVSGSITVTSNATNASLAIPVSGTGVAAGSHMVALQWQASTTSGVTGYDVYRSTVSGGSYAKLTSTPLAGTAYSDSSVTSGNSYYYVVTSVSSNGSESSYSNQVSATVP